MDWLTRQADDIADARAAVNVSDAQPFGRRAAVATALHQASQSANCLDPWSGKAESGQQLHGLGDETRRRRDADDRTKDAAIPAEGAQQYRRTFKDLCPDTGPDARYRASSTPHPGTDQAAPLWR